MSTIKTTSISLGTIGDIAKAGKIYNVSHSGSGWNCNTGDCSNGALIGICNPCKSCARNERCGCLSKNNKCPAMMVNGAPAEGKILDINQNPIRKDNCCSAPSDLTPNWSNCLQDDNNVPIITCEYNSTAIPTDDQAWAMIKNINNPKTNDDMLFLANYCFSQEPDDTNCPPHLTTCPRAISKSDICNVFGNKYKDIYDQRAKQYCINTYNKNKDNEDFDISKTGCKCLYDQMIVPNKGLSALLTTPGINAAANCIWGPCIPQMGNLNTYEDRDSECSTVNCMSLINIAGEAIVDDSTFIQNITCSGSKCPECPADYGCNDSTGKCEPKKCKSNTECGEGYTCSSNGSCIPHTSNPPEPEKTCISESDCGTGYKCVDGSCVPDSPPAPAPPSGKCTSNSDCSNLIQRCSDGKCTTNYTYIGIISAVVFVIIVIVIIYFVRRNSGSNTGNDK